MLLDNPQQERAEHVPLPWLLVLVAWAWLLALVLFVAA
jgi:hypothetical protein